MIQTDNGDTNDKPNKNLDKPRFFCSKRFFLLLTTRLDILENIVDLIHKDGSEIYVSL